ncbi:bacteriohemerythrin [Rhodoplanes serenus]
MKSFRFKDGSAEAPVVVTAVNAMMGSSASLPPRSRACARKRGSMQVSAHHLVILCCYSSRLVTGRSRDMLIGWKDHYAIDDGVIDDDHRFLIAALSMIIDQIRKKIPVCALLRNISHVRGVAELHFKREEKLQKQSNYPCHRKHCEEHREIIRKLDEIVNQLADLPGDREYSDPDEVKSFLYRWILAHITESDQRMKPYLAEIQTEAELPLRLMAQR